ncbi:mechanosensitive ion channel family protein [Scleromatobacter humisilvae]|uniref:Mechanosensitive ion channel n=1 Tax=Scleromatobacter humisilvae TaxID=2897159 RepID=A0A9X1YFT0_9BURK|nr:mechanosensitive ion channel domain-containing protein [Scleromatobacter humisilvae]MCK9684675.1 mechanosensitive ion channel [Scleromatobacter humisilvae]
MDWSNFTHTLAAYNVDLFSIGKSEITVFTLVKLTISALVLWLVAGRFSRWTLNRLLGRTHMQEGQRLAIAGLVHYAVLIFGAVVILQNAGIELTAFAIVGSALGVGVGFGLQNIISNFISGLIVLLERPIEIGDRIEVAGVEGVVKEVGARRTTVVTPDQVAILVPNQSFITSNVTNYSYLRQTVRLRVPVPIAGGQDVRRVETLLLEAAQQAGLLADPKPEVAITSVAASAIVLELWAWYDGKQFARSAILSRAYYAIVDTLARNEIKLAS